MTNEQDDDLKDLACYDCGKYELYRKGRAHYVCSNCDKDNSLFVVLMWEAQIRERERIAGEGE